jgi:L-aminopeptidase/D-esterase-like protein
MDSFGGAITEVHGIRVGQAEDPQGITGCTVILCEKGAVAGVDQRGGAPGTRETDALRPMHAVDKAHAVVLAGGSAFGLDAASGVMRYLREIGAGFDTGVAKVPIVPSAILFDLALGKPEAFPSADMGYAAAKAASSSVPLQGNHGAGTGATVGKIFGMAGAMKSGIGTASIDLGGGLVVGAIMAVNAFGDVIDPEQGKIIAGARPIQRGPLRLGGAGPFAGTLEVMRSTTGRGILRLASRQNTVIGVVATNAKLTKEEANKAAQMAQNGLAKAIRPANTLFDGDTVFLLATGEHRADLNLIGAFAAEVVAQAILNAVLFAEPLAGFPSASTYPPQQGERQAGTDA